MLRPSVRVLGARDLEEAVAVCAQDPVSHAFVSSRLVARAAGRRAATPRSGASTSAPTWSRSAGWAPTWSPSRPAARRARRLRRPRPPHDPAQLVAVRPARRRAPAVGRARAARGARPARCAATSRSWCCDTPLVEPDPRVRRHPPGRARHAVPRLGRHVHRGDRLLARSAWTAAPATGPGSPRWSASGRSFVRIDPDADGRPEVVFKAELGRRDRRGRPGPGRLGRPAPPRRGPRRARRWPPSSRPSHRDLGARGSLYVNDYNARAVHVYERVGFMRHGGPSRRCCSVGSQPCRCCSGPARRRRGSPSAIRHEACLRPRSAPSAAAVPARRVASR